MLLGKERQSRFKAAKERRAVLVTFKILKKAEKSGQGGKGIALGVGFDTKIGDGAVEFSLTPMFENYSDFRKGVDKLKGELEDLCLEAEMLFSGGEAQEDISGEMSGREIWEKLSQIGDEEEFARQFNLLGEDKRREVAEHVLTQCNIFSGKASIFSARYNSKSLLLE